MVELVARVGRFLGLDPRVANHHRVRCRKGHNVLHGELEKGDLDHPALLPVLDCRVIGTAAARTDKPLAATAPKGRRSQAKRTAPIRLRTAMHEVNEDPELASRSVHLVPNNEGGVKIEVDGTYYARPRDIEDRKIQLYLN